jgi:hypothetical protein
MPTIYINGFKFRFYSSEVNEPPHVHVIHAEGRILTLRPILVGQSCRFAPSLSRLNDLRSVKRGERKLLGLSDIWVARQRRPADVAVSRCAQCGTGCEDLPAITRNCI